VNALEPTETHIGLMTEEAERRLRQYGRNVISEAQPFAVALFAHKFWGVIPWMLEAAILINILISRWAEAILIAVLLVFQASLGFYQERNGKRAVDLLKQKLSILANVKRDGAWRTLPSAEIVPGDLVHLQAGNIVPADIAIVDGYVLVDQSQLTGESMSVEVAADKTAYAGSLVTQGEAFGNVSSTGDNTYYGRAASLVRLAEKPPLLQRLALQIARYLLVLDVALAIAAIIVLGATGGQIASILVFVLMLLVLSVPVALPAMSTLSATVGTGALAKMGVLTTRLSAIEDAAAMDVLCIDKTGTLTENRPTVERIVAFSPYSEDAVLYFAAHTVDVSSQEPINLALLDSAKERNLMGSGMRITNFVLEPFDPRTKSSGASWISEGGKEIRAIKGEPLSIAKLTNTSWSEIADRVTELSQSGNRVLAVAVGDKSELKLAGFITLTDQIRKDSADLIAQVKKNGIRVVLVTGDGRVTAESVAARVGIEGATVPDATDYESMRPDLADRYNIFPRVLPQDKYLIVKALQDAGHVVGMTGDGVNDAPALRQASVGIATANATDVAKSAAGLVLTQPGLTNIRAMIMVSRNIHQRMRTWILAMITRKGAIPIFITLGLLLFREEVITPTLAFMFMLFGDVVTFSLSKDNVLPSTKPDRWDMRSMVTYGSAYASLMLLMSVLVFWIARYSMGTPLVQAQPIVFTWLVLVGGQAVLYLVRTRRVFWEKPYPSSWFAGATILTVLVAAAMANFGFLMEPISLAWIVALLIAAFFYVLIGNGLLAIIRYLGK